MGEVLTKSEFARQRGVEPAAVSAWIARGHLSSPALMEDGRIDVDLALEQLRNRLDPARSSTRLDGDDVAAPVEPTLAEQVRRQRLEEGELRLRRLRREELESRGFYVRTEDIRRAHAREWSQFIATVEGRLPELVALLGGGKAEVAAARQWWRGLRQSVADAARERAATFPEFVRDAGEDGG